MKPDIFTSPDFFPKLEARWANGLFSCVGLDSDIAKIPSAVSGGDVQYKFNAEIVDATHDLLAAYKPNLGFYLGRGEDGIRSLRLSISHIRKRAPEIPIILDGKHGDIASTNDGYVQLAKELGVDAMTIAPYLGGEANKPFLAERDMCSIVLCRTSNPEAGEFQDLRVLRTKDEMSELLGIDPELEDDELDELAREFSWYENNIPVHYLFPKLYQYVALRVAERWSMMNGNCGLVAGATAPKELAEIRRLAGDTFLLIPGVGKQGGDAATAARNGRNSFGTGFVINSSRDIIFAGGEGRFAEVSRSKLVQLNDQIAAGLAS